MVTTKFEYLNLDYLNIMTGNDTEMMQTMISMLVEELPVEIEKMHTTLQNKDWNELFNISHKMKTTLSFIGNNEMTEINKDVEHHARNQKHLELLPDMIQRLDHLGVHALREMSSLMAD